MSALDQATPHQYHVLMRTQLPGIFLGDTFLAILYIGRELWIFLHIWRYLWLICWGGLARNIHPHTSCQTCNGAQQDEATKQGRLHD